MATGQRYFVVVVYEGTPAPEMVRSVGPFRSVDAANAWCEREELGQTPVEGEWATVVGQVPEREEDE